MNINDIQIDNPTIGVFIYRNTLPKNLNLTDRLDKTISENQDSWFKWSEAQVGDYVTMKDYRDCVDFKVRKQDFEVNQKAANSDLKKIYDDIDERLQVCLKHYCSMFNLSMEYQEAVNFVKYEKGQHFQVHSDHGFSYVCTVSTVMYLNDDYKGGGLFFPYLNYTYEPKEGDIVLFPSNFLYSHAALPVEEGIKYAAVTMFDYNSRTHGYNETIKNRPTQSV
jgi:Rps23 Pro-64 3,4-dihydroxylase Tpa1-like proline 4-hydroxylase